MDKYVYAYYTIFICLYITLSALLYILRKIKKNTYTHFYIRQTPCTYKADSIKYNNT